MSLAAALANSYAQTGIIVPPPQQLALSPSVLAAAAGARGGVGTSSAAATGTGLYQQGYGARGGSGAVAPLPPPPPPQQQQVMGGAYPQQSQHLASVGSDYGRAVGAGADGRGRGGLSHVQYSSHGNSASGPRRDDRGYTDYRASGGGSSLPGHQHPSHPYSSTGMHPPPRRGEYTDQQRYPHTPYGAGAGAPPPSRSSGYRGDDAYYTSSSSAAHYESRGGGGYRDYYPPPPPPPPSHHHHSQYRSGPPPPPSRYDKRAFDDYYRDGGEDRGYGPVKVSQLMFLVTVVVVVFV